MSVEVEQKLSNAFNYLFDCLDADLRSGQPSRDSAFLETIMDGLYSVEFLGNAHRMVRRLLEKFHKNYSTDVKVEPETVMKTLLKASQAEMVSEDQFLSLASSLNIPPLAPTINFLTQLTEITRLLPMKIYPREENRARLLDALQRATDAVIEVEGLPEPE